ncbi:MAG TPA: VOC family protein [Hyphomicrobiales bacterium]|nr:VOC family protein [Hyphomicrobiales bacterium]
MLLQKLHHVAFRCNNAAETVEFYTKVLGLTFANAVSADYVPSVKQHNPHIHIFFEMADGSYIAFFEVPQSPPAQKDPNTPDWVQHLALEVKDDEALREGVKRLEAAGVDFIGPIDHGVTHSVYFFDPSGHRLEMAVRTELPGDRERYIQEAPELLRTWQKRNLRYDPAGHAASTAS